MSNPWGANVTRCQRCNGVIPNVENNDDTNDVDGDDKLPDDDD